MILVAVDYGSRRLGMAVSDALGLTCRPLPFVARTGNAKDAAVVASIARDLGAGGLVLGLPLLEGGDEGEQAGKARRFGRSLAEASGLPVTFWDERWSTAEAERRLAEAGVRREKRKELRDGIAAALILQSYLDAAGGSR